MVDIGFGGDGATKPLPMISGHVLQNLGPQEMRLLHDHIPEQTDRSEHTKLWIYQYRNGADSDWHSFYAFPELEFLEQDFDIMHWYTGSSPDSFQTYRMMVVKFLRRRKQDEDGDANAEEVIYGKRMLVDGIVKENLGGKTKIVQVCGTEEERVEALGKWFGIGVTEEQRKGIVGWCTELR
jgi:hypothetical protein